MDDSVLQINGALAGYTDVLSVSLSSSGAALGYSLSLAMADSDGAAIILHCDDVSNLTIRDFGGGLAQFLCLRATDVRNIQHDRVAFHFADLERNAVAFDCSAASVSNRPGPAR